MRACGQAARPMNIPTLRIQQRLNHTRDKIGATFSFGKRDGGVLETNLKTGEHKIPKGRGEATCGSVGQNKRTYDGKKERVADGAFGYRSRHVLGSSEERTNRKSTHEREGKGNE